MYLLEHDAKELLAAHGIPVPAGCLIEHLTAQPALPAGPWIVKGQITAGGRGKAGIIRKAATPREVAEHVLAILGRSVKDRTVESVRVEQQVQAAQEIYIGFLLDAGSGGVRVMLSANGGMDIEQVPHGQLLTGLARPEEKALIECVDQLAGKLPSGVATAAREAGHRLARAFLGLECMLVEINPLFVLDGGRWVAGDAKVVTDDNALPRQKALESLVKARAAAYPDVARKHEHGFDYVEVDPEGEIGLLTTGAGLSMMLIDELRAAGLKPFNFLDIRTGGLRGETTRLTQVLQWIGQGKKVKVLLVNIFAGITDLGEFSRLLVQALGAANLRPPVVARLVGTNLAAARDTLAAAKIGLHTDLDAAIAEVRRHLNK
ncbi:MAG TPA: ATP-grasp domain-containing protein [Burkholderiales bacterium]|nr:ATP-grasp domain-containing protein [Burkholderiales bacterium]